MGSLQRALCRELIDQLCILKWGRLEADEDSGIKPQLEHSN